VTNSTLGDAVIQGDGDLPSGLTPEQIDSAGDGKVPIHRTGKYRSPLANPALGGPATIKVGFVISEIRVWTTHGSRSRSVDHCFDVAA
jgi:hypothetical protein